jgi:hypothetical protein
VTNTCRVWRTRYQVKPVVWIEVDGFPRTRSAYRVAWEEAFGDVPDGFRRHAGIHPPLGGIGACQRARRMWSRGQQLPAIRWE